ncbi:hypothetical protein EOM33_06170 [Candidatus Saccharibacteria bacterium]|nr:hypothetical protein [Candidatus Saccharibacteria bacterium]
MEQNAARIVKFMGIGQELRVAVRYRTCTYPGVVDRHEIVRVRNTNPAEAIDCPSFGSDGLST